MKLPEINQQAFERWVPAFTSATDETFLQIQPEIEYQKEQLEEYIGEGVIDETGESTEGTIRICESAQKLICLRAAANTIEHLDLTLTPYGFGITRNDSIAPASPERVNALKQRIRQQKSDCFDKLKDMLSGTPWNKTPQARTAFSLMMRNATIARLYGLDFNHGPLFEEEYNILRPCIAEAESRVKGIISRELYDRFIRANFGELFTVEEYTFYGTVETKALELIAAYAKADSTPAIYAELKQDLQIYLQKNKEHLPEFAKSSLAERHERYKNKKTDRTFFFG